MKFIVSTLICFLLLAISSGPIKAQTEVALPNTAAGNQLKEWLRVFDSADDQVFKRYIISHYSKSQLAENDADYRADRQARTYLDTRGFGIRDIEKSTEQEVVVLAQARLTELWFRITMKVESAPPHLITEYTPQRIQPPAKFPPKKLSQKQFVAEVARFVNRLAAADAFSGTLLVAKDGKPIFKAVHGLASKAYNVPNRLDTRFSVASIGKMFTAIAIAQLVEQGKLSFTDPVGKHLTDYPNKEVARKVTIHHLLTHSSGLGDTYSAKYICRKGVLKQVKDWLLLFVDDPKPLAFEPGTRWSYSNQGFILLGAIIEKVSGENFFDYIQKHIFDPAGMVNTGYYEGDRDTPNLAMGYTNFEDLGEDNYQFHLGERRNVSLYNGARGGPTGGAASTLDDLLRFNRALRENKLISAKMLQLLTSSKIVARKYDANQTYWGYGFELELIDGQRVIGHGGGDLGVSSGIRWYPDSGNYSFVVLSNYDRGGILVNYKLQEMIVKQVVH
ncbi:MAG TPA: serine hydrolase domain-containing protein [Pyrinomonadaceae bacterium]|nr:serine hydrolase domain-containing protein [Pyrinomonadaceae bacterium]